MDILASTLPLWLRQRGRRKGVVEMRRRACKRSATCPRSYCKGLSVARRRVTQEISTKFLTSKRSRSSHPSGMG